MSSEACVLRRVADLGDDTPQHQQRESHHGTAPARRAAHRQPQAGNAPAIRLRGDAQRPEPPAATPRSTIPPSIRRPCVHTTSSREPSGSTICEDAPPSGIPGSSIRRCRLPFRNEKRIEAVVKSKASVMVLGLPDDDQEGCALLALVGAHVHDAGEHARIAGQIAGALHPGLVRTGVRAGG